MSDSELQNEPETETKAEPRGSAPIELPPDETLPDPNDGPPPMPPEEEWGPPATRLPDLPFELTEQQHHDLKIVFDMFDINENGFIGLNDLRVIIRGLCEEPTKDQLRRMMRSVDDQRTGEVSFNDFVFLMTKKMGEKDSPEDLIKAFRLMDETNSGKLTFKTLKTVCGILGEEKNDEEIQEMIDFADYDKNGVVDEEEFVRALRKTSLMQEPKTITLD